MLNITINGISIAKYSINNYSKIISLINPGVKTEFGWPIHDNHKIIECYDTDEVINNFHPPTINNIREILLFSKDFSSKDKIMIHCNMGVARSTATTIGILVQHGVSTLDAFKYVYQIRQVMKPNKTILKLMDQELGLGSKLFDLSNTPELWK